jgi:hypothetical protein
MDDFWNSLPADVEDLRDTPPGRYRGFMSGYQLVRTDDAKNYAILEFKVAEPLSGQDMTGVETNRPLRSGRLYFTPKAAPISKKSLKNLFPQWNDDVPWKDNFEQMVGTEAVFEYRAEKGMNGKEYLNVTKFQAA